MFMTANSYAGWAVEATRGTAASVSTYTPVTTPKIEPKQIWLPDPNFRGSPVAQYDQVQGVRYDEYSAKTFLYTDVFPQLLRAVLGSTDTVASAGASTWSHTIGLINSASTGSQPPSYTIVNDSVDNTYRMVAAQCDNLSISFAADAAVETTFMFMGNPSASIASITNFPNETVQHIIPAWNCAASIGGASVTAVETGQLDIKRTAGPIWTLGTAGPYRNWAGPIDVTGKFSFVVEANNPYFNQALTRNEQSVSFQFTDPFTNYSITFTMSACQLENPIIDQSRHWISMSADLVAVSNTTDAVNGGYSPIQTVTINGISAQY